MPLMPSENLTLLLRMAEQLKLGGVARRLGETEMAKGVRGKKPSAGSALQQPLLDQERLDDLLDGVARLGERRGDGLDADRPAAVILRNIGKIAPVHRVEPGGIHFELG